MMTVLCSAEMCVQLQRKLCGYVVFVSVMPQQLETKGMDRTKRPESAPIRKTTF